MDSSILPALSSVIELQNVTFKDNTADDGGAIRLSSNSNLVGTNITFKNNTAARRGGAIVSIGESPASIVNSTFINNTASNGAAIFVENLPIG